ncbi:amidohydrolase family protein [Microbacterium sp. Be9]|uniref:amidohydrolase family protein n=1 Tax=Microbacterium sp. Be9 TaxID=2720211 RepID=UPI00142053F7|nr:amidohydrolase family protein [Microbacterium sp. Be9]
MTTLNPADTSTWLPLEGLAPGFDANKAPHSTALSGREITVVDARGTRIVHRFADAAVTWEYQPGAEDATEAASDTDDYEAFEVDADLYFVQFHHRYLPNEAVSLILDLRHGRALAVISEILAAPEKGRTRVQHHFAPGVIEGAEVSGAEAAPTTTLIGRRVEWVYSTEHAYEHVYLSPRWYSWQCLAGPESDIPRLQALDVSADISPFIWYPGVIPQALSEVLGERAEHSQPNRALIDAGARVAGGSDWPVSDSPNTLEGLQGLVTRADPLGRAPGTLWPEQAITAEEALEVFTINAATAMGLGDETGSLTPGKSADFVVLARDAIAGPAEDIVRTEVISTWFAGRRVHGD